MVKEHGLNVYFDGDFSGHNPLWTDQFPENMESGNCRGVDAFIDDAYTKSYVTLMELKILVLCEGSVNAFVITANTDKGYS